MPSTAAARYVVVLGSVSLLYQIYKQLLPGAFRGSLRRVGCVNDLRLLDQSNHDDDLHFDGDDVGLPVFGKPLKRSKAYLDLTSLGCHRLEELQRGSDVGFSLP